MCLCSCTPCEGIHAQVTSQGGGGERGRAGARSGNGGGRGGEANSAAKKDGSRAGGSKTVAKNGWKFAFGLQGEGLGRGLVSINHQNARGLWPRRIETLFFLLRPVCCSVSHGPQTVNPEPLNCGALDPTVTDTLKTLALKPQSSNRWSAAGKQPSELGGLQPRTLPRR